jgi:pimeloyl-ACP methyl ester carboxylesterase
MSQETVTSVDGTPIAYWRSGDGPPLVLVHGSFDDHNVWAPVLPAFEERFSVYAVASIKTAAEAVDEALANSRMVVMPGQGHVAMNTGIELFTSEVLWFLTAE